MRKLLLCLFTFSVVNSWAQLTITNGSHVLEIGGMVSVFYNQRFLKPGETDMSKNRFGLRDAQLVIDGRFKNLVEYKIQCDFADLVANISGGQIDPENPGLMDAYATFKGVPFLNISAGYAKVPYGRSTQVPFAVSPFWQRAEIVRGDLFSRRDVGAWLTSTFWKQRINVQFGVYTGLGELSLRGENDPSGAPEYIGRVEVAYPSRYRLLDIDERVTPIPMFMIGLSGRYYNKSLPAGTFLPAYAAGPYDVKVIDGQRLAYGLDVSAQYMGFSAQFEIHQMRMTPNNPNSALFQGVAPSDHRGYVLCGGYYVQASYYSKFLRSTFSVRFDELNLSDLAPGVSRRLSVGYAYKVKGTGLMFKGQYFKVLQEEAIIDPYKWTDQFRIGLQYQFQ